MTSLNQLVSRAEYSKRDGLIYLQAACLDRARPLFDFALDEGLQIDGRPTIGRHKLTANLLHLRLDDAVSMTAIVAACSLATMAGGAPLGRNSANLLVAWRASGAFASAHGAHDLHRRRQPDLGPIRCNRELGPAGRLDAGNYFESFGPVLPSVPTHP